MHGERAFVTTAEILSAKPGVRLVIFNASVKTIVVGLLASDKAAFYRKICSVTSRDAVVETGLCARDPGY